MATSELLCVRPAVVRLTRLAAGQEPMCQVSDISWHSFLCFLFQTSDHLAYIFKIRPNHRKWPKGHCANLKTEVLTLRWSVVKVRRSSLDGCSFSNRIVSAPLE